ncbi:MAG: hypothetical protein U0797_17960 [Gemmataceae bacterium]
MRGAGRYALKALAAASVGLLGCGGRPQVHPVEGKLLVGGRPAANARLAFHPLGGGASGARVPVATTWEHGTFRLTTYASGDGAPAGEYAVTVVWPDDSLALDECADPVAHDRLAGSYSDPARTTLRVTIRPGRNEVPLRVAVARSWSLPRQRDEAGRK